MVYEWTINNSRVKAQDAGELCESLKNTVGLTPKTLLDASRAEDALLHNEFEWNDDIAAEKYRLGQAQHIIANLKIVADGSTEPTRAFVTVRGNQSVGDGYEHIVDVMSDEEKRARLLETAKTELKWFKAKYSNLKELAKVMKAIDEICD